MKLSKTQMQREIVGQSALSLLASGIQFIEIPRTIPTFDFAFERAFKACDLEAIYPHILGLNYSDPQDLIESSITHERYEIPDARWYRTTRSDINYYELRFTSQIDQVRLEEGDDPQDIVEEIISHNYEYTGTSLFETWPWAGFGNLIVSELNSVDITSHLAKGSKGPKRIQDWWDSLLEDEHHAIKSEHGKINSRTAARISAQGGILQTSIQNRDYAHPYQLNPHDQEWLDQQYPSTNH